MKKGDKYFCYIYEDKDKMLDCKRCRYDEDSPWYNQGKKVDHKICLRFPTQPFMRVIESGECGFKFTPVTEWGKKRFEYLKNLWR